MTTQRGQHRSALESSPASSPTRVEMRALLQRYEATLDDLLHAESGSWSPEAQHLLEELEASVRWQRVQSLSQHILEDPREGFYLDTTRRVWVRYSDLIGEITTIFGMRGAGKSNTVALITEKLLLRGVPLTVIDPHGEYYSLRALPCSLLVVGITGGAAAQPDLVMDPAYAAPVAAFSVQQGISIILDLSGLKKAVRYEVLGYYFEALWTACAREKRTYHIVLEEAHAYIPQQGSSPVDDIVSDLSTEYRKFGVGMVVIDQRPANVKKTPITQARVRILHEVDHPLDVERYQELVPKRYTRRMDEILASFVAGTALVKIHKQIDIIQVQTRETVHIGVTPSLDGTAPAIAIARDEHLVQQLQALLATAPLPPERSPSGERRKLQALQAQLEESMKQHEGLRQENSLLREQIILPGQGRIPASAGKQAHALPDGSSLPTSLTLTEATVERVYVGTQATRSSEVASAPTMQETRAGKTKEAHSTSAPSIEQLRTRLEAQERSLAQKEARIEELQTAMRTLKECHQEKRSRPQASAQVQAAEKPRLEAPTVPPAQLTASQNVLVTELIARVNALPRFQRHLLLALLPHDQAMTMNEIAARQGRTRANLANRRATQIKEMHLIERTAEGYQSTLVTYCRERLLNAPVALVRARFLHEVQR